MHDTAVGTRSVEARARRRRMHRRFATRRLASVLVVSVVVFVVASLLTPAPAVRPTRDVVNNIAHAAGPLATQPAWRPAGEVLSRSADFRHLGTTNLGQKFGAPARRDTSAMALPFGLASKAVAKSETEPRESLSRWHRIYTYTMRYQVKLDLARRIYDAAVNAGIEPELGFRLVRVESVFNPRAQSPAGALGLTQLMVGTARDFEPNVTREELLNPDINLRIGFRYLRSLIRENKGDLKLALLVYNRGPSAVRNAISMGIDPTNGYESIVMRGYRGRGTLD